MSASQDSPTTVATLVGLLNEYGLRPGEPVMQMVRYGAAVQQDRRQRGVAPLAALTRTSALWAAVRVDADIASILASHGLTSERLDEMLSLNGPIEPMYIDDVNVRDDLARALREHLSSSEEPTVEVGDIVIASLADAIVNGGKLAERLSGLGIKTGAVLDDVRQRGINTRGSSNVDEQTSGRIDLDGVTDAATDFLGFYDAVGGDVAGPAAMWGAFCLVAAKRSDTTASLVIRTVLNIDDRRLSPRDHQRAIELFGLTTDTQPTPSTTLIDSKSPTIGVQARSLRDVIEPAGAVHLRHLLAAAIEIAPALPDPEASIDIDLLRQRFLTQIDIDAPGDVARKWRTRLTQAQTRHPSDVGDTPAKLAEAHTFAGIDADALDDQALRDSLGVLGDVVALCDVLAARETVPPVSVGLFGRWGSGKSYFMALMRQRIKELAVAARPTAGTKNTSAYCDEIAQITFNAWHYMDASLWATLAVRLFEEIAQLDAPTDENNKREKLIEELRDAELGLDPIDRKIVRVLSDERLDTAAAKLGIEANRQSVVGLFQEFTTSKSYVLGAWRLMRDRAFWTGRRTTLRAVVVVVITTLAVTAVIVVNNTSVSQWKAWLPAAVAVVGFGGRFVHQFASGLRQINAVAAGSGLRPVDVTDERIKKDANINELRSEIERLDRAAGMREWVKERALSPDYRNHFGVISVLRQDLEDLVIKQRAVAPDRRIVLYIDDLDRCPPLRVVEVLQAVHLLLAFPLFVVVVGVDPRWLLRSLERHYREVLSTASDSQTHGDSGDQMFTESTPHDYLEKIFQIPFSLDRMNPAGYGRLIDSLVGAPAGLAETLRDSPATDIDPVGSLNTTGSVVVEPVQVVVDVEQPKTAVDNAVEPSPSEGGSDGMAAVRSDAVEIDVPEPESLAPINLNASRLRVTEDEVIALRAVSELIATPRAAKRLVNLYRLIRAGIDEPDLDGFVSRREYEPLIMLLALQVAFPTIASTMLSGVMNAAYKTSFSELLSETNSLAQSGGAPFGDSERSRLMLGVAKATVAAHPQFDRPMSDLKPWVSRVRRYSFEDALEMRSVPAPP